MVKRIIILLFLILFSTSAFGTPNMQIPEKQTTQEEGKKYTFIYNVTVLNQKVFPAIYKYLDSSNFKTPITEEQGKIIIKNLQQMFYFFAINKYLIIQAVRFSTYENTLLITIFLYEYNQRSSKLIMTLIGKEIDISVTKHSN